MATALGSRICWRWPTAREWSGRRARARITGGRAAVDRALDAGEAVYGPATQIGHGSDTRLSEELGAR